MSEPLHTADASAAPDFSLMLARIQDQVVGGNPSENCLKILAQERIWKQIDAEKQLVWANLAQIAGNPELALNVLTHVCHVRPELQAAWIQRLELLWILGKARDAAQVFAEARHHLSKEQLADWANLLKTGAIPEFDSDIAPAAAPFETLRRRQLLIEHYLKLFSGRDDCFARQWVNRDDNKQGYMPVRRPLTHQDIEDHLHGRKTYGIYFLRPDGSVNVSAIDVDLIPALRSGKRSADDRNRIRREFHYMVSRIAEIAGSMGLNPLEEFSGGKGWHFWFFFEPAIPAASARQMLEHIRQCVAGDVSAFQFEVFPKQDHLSGKGFGNLVKLPLGIHRLTGKPSYFLRCADRSTQAQLDFLLNIHPIQPENLKSPNTPSDSPKLLIHPRHQQWAHDYPELFTLEQTCPPLAQIMASCRNGSISVREEKILFQTIGFIHHPKRSLHHLFAGLSDYNPHLVDFKLSRVRGTPLGCRRIHSLLNFPGDFCRFDVQAEYAHPLLHLKTWETGSPGKSEKIDNLRSALENLKTAIVQVNRFLTP